MVFFGPLLIKN